MKEEVLKKLREIASYKDNVAVNHHLTPDEHIRWYWAWQSAEQASEWTMKDLAQIYFDGGIKPYLTAEEVAAEIVEFDKENLEATYEHFKKFLKGEID